MIQLEYIFTVDAGTSDNHRAVAVQNTNRLVHVGKWNFYLGFAFGKPNFFVASLLRDFHAIEDL